MCVSNFLESLPTYTQIVFKRNTLTNYDSLLRVFYHCLEFIANGMLADAICVVFSYVVLVVLLQESR